MVRISLHKQQQKQELKDANIKISKGKYNFSPEFAEELYKFSESHHKDHFKIFNAELQNWMSIHQEAIENEIIRMKTAGAPGDIYDKIKISARFYYRKKSKKAPIVTEKQPYMGLSQEFIQTMDEYIKEVLLQNAENIKRKMIFSEFTETHLEDINEELRRLKQKYGTYEPVKIAQKIKKSFDNRFYTMCK